MTPILVADGVFEYKEIAERFKKKVKTLMLKLQVLFYEKLAQFQDSDINR